MTHITFSFIYGAMIGFEFMDRDICEQEEISWGLVLDLLFIRISIFGDDSFLEEKSA